MLNLPSISVLSLKKSPTAKMKGSGEISRQTNNGEHKHTLFLCISECTLPLQYTYLCVCVDNLPSIRSDWLISWW